LFCACIGRVFGGDTIWSITLRIPATLRIALTIGERWFSKCSLPVSVTLPFCTIAESPAWELARSNLWVTDFCSALSLFVYICMPAIGPWIHPTLHREGAGFLFPTFGTQQMILQRANLLWSHTISPEVTRVDVTDAFVSFPSLHIAVPFIAIWFLRDYKRLFWVCLTVYVCLLVPSVVLLEWHYIVDVVGGLVTAVLAIWFSSIVTGPEPGHRRTGDQCDSSLHSI
jgi:membrane-associated phospholipid phosphatase